MPMIHYRASETSERERGRYSQDTRLIQMLAKEWAQLKIPTEPSDGVKLSNGLSFPPK